MQETTFTRLPDGRHRIMETLVDGFAERTLYINPDRSSDEDYFFRYPAETDERS